MVHGGAGNPSREKLGDEARFHAGLRAAIDAAVARIADGAVAAAIAAVEVLEDDPAFNAGRGSVLTSDGTVEMDAAVMDGRSGLAGAVAAVSDVRHPIALAHAVMERSPHVLLAAHGARRLADEIGMDATDPAWFAVADRPEETTPGTVGAVVLDGQGGLAAATSTGGRSQQAPGRIGDTPVIGAGTWADRRRAVSMTGHGEAILRNASAHSIALSTDVLEGACRAGLEALGSSDAGLIAIDADGAIALPFNTRVMHRGWWTAGSVETRVGAS